MGLVGRLVWVNNYSKKQCRNLFWRLRAAVKKAAGKNGGKKQFKFQYDPWSYALNFDDGVSGGVGVGGSSNMGVEVGNGPFHKGEVVAIQGFSEGTVWGFVIWVESCK